MRPKAMMMAGVVLMCFGATATAKSLVLTAAEARSELFGVELSGIVEGEATSWRECIEPDGDTLYEIDGTLDRGRLTISDNGDACFSYASSNFTRVTCWSIERVGRNDYRFSYPGSSVFVTRVVERGVRQCAPGRGALVG
jgi:hypothetical protein